MLVASRERGGRSGNSMGIATFTSSGWFGFFTRADIQFPFSLTVSPVIFFFGPSTACSGERNDPSESTCVCHESLSTRSKRSAWQCCIVPLYTTIVTLRCQPNSPRVFLFEVQSLSTQVALAFHKKLSISRSHDCYMAPFHSGPPSPLNMEPPSTSSSCENVTCRPIICAPELKI